MPLVVDFYSFLVHLFLLSHLLFRFLSLSHISPTSTITMSTAVTYGGYVRVELGATDSAALDEMVLGTHAVFVQEHTAPPTAHPWPGILHATADETRGDVSFCATEADTGTSTDRAVLRLPLAACVHVCARASSVYLLLRESPGMALCHRVMLATAAETKVFLRAVYGVLAQVPDDETVCAPAPVRPRAEAATSPNRGGRRPSWSVATTLIRRLRGGNTNTNGSDAPRLLGVSLAKASSPHTLQHQRHTRRERRLSNPLGLSGFTYDEGQPLYDVRTMAGLEAKGASSHGSLDSGWDSDADTDSVPRTPPMARRSTNAKIALSASLPSTIDEGVNLDDNAIVAREAADLAILRSKPYYHGVLDWEAAAARLANAPPGAFLVRATDAGEEDYAVSAVGYRGTVSHLSVLHFSGRFHVTGCVADRFHEVTTLVEHHMAAGTLLSGCRLYQYIPAL